MLGDLDIEESKKTLSEDDEDDNEDFDLNIAYKSSPESHSYKDVLDIIDSYEDEKIKSDFEARFPKNKNISKKDYFQFAYDYIDDMSEIDYIKANWVSLTDEDIFEKVGLAESKKTLSENQPAIYNDIEQDLMNGGFENIEGQIDYLQDIIKFCQEKIKEISGGLNENIDKDKLKKYYEYLLNLGGGDLGGDYGDMLNKAKDFSSVEEFIEDDINILATDDKKQAIEIRKWVEQNIKESKQTLSEDKEDLLNFIKVNGEEIAKQVGASRIEDITIDSLDDVGATGIYVDDDGDELEGGLAFRFPEDVDDKFVGENGDEPRPITVAGKKLMYVGYNI
jgi:hypothetical protein